MQQCPTPLIIYSKPPAGRETVPGVNSTAPNASVFDLLMNCRFPQHLLIALLIRNDFYGSTL